MGITRENKRIASAIRKNLAQLAKDTNGYVEDRPGSGGKIVSTYVWDAEGSRHGFTMVWHNSVSDRHYVRKVAADVRRKLSEVPGFNVEKAPGKSAMRVSVDSEQGGSVRDVRMFLRKRPVTVQWALAMNDYLSGLEEAQSRRLGFRRWWRRRYIEKQFEWWVERIRK